MKSNMQKHIVVGLSGGVDSSVAAFILKEQGHHVTGVFMKNWIDSDTDSFCSDSVDMTDAALVCDKLQIELRRVNFSEDYWERVFTHFLAEYKKGRTPNPDILCNKEIKFNAFLHYAKLQGADFIATGHYARCQFRKNDSSYQLLKGLDQEKDQSYFLYALNQEQLSQSLFPIGELNKSTVREMARKIGLKNHAKKDSTGICFIGEKKIKSFLSQYLVAEPGKIETIDGIVIGEHDGLLFYTLGQRQGLKIGGLKNFSEMPWYVVHKNKERNVLIVAQGQSHPSLYTNALIASSIHWIDAPDALPLKASAKTRYRQKDQACIIHSVDSADEKKYRIEFIEPQRAVTPGQSVVFYQDDLCLGGGIIESS